MKKITTGSTVYHRSIISSLREAFDNRMTVTKVEKTPLGTLACTCRNDRTGKNKILMDDSLVAEEDIHLEQISKGFHSLASLYSARLLKEIKEVLGGLLPEGDGMIDIDELYQEDWFDRIGKYETPKDYPANYILSRFGLDKSGKFFAEGDDVDDSDCEYTFSEYDFSIDELEAIYEIVSSIPADMEKGLFVINRDGRVKVARYEHLGYYNDTEDLRAFIGKDAGDIANAMIMGEGHFYAADRDEITVEDLENEFNDGKHRTTDGNSAWDFSHNGNFIVVNGILALDDPEKALAEDNPDSGVFIDIYSLVSD